MTDYLRFIPTFDCDRDQVNEYVSQFRTSPISLDNIMIDLQRKSLNLALAKIILAKEKGHDLDSILFNGHTLLTYAAKYSFYTVVCILCEMGVDVNKLNKEGHSALYEASASFVIELLTDKYNAKKIPEKNPFEELPVKHIQYAITPEERLALAFMLSIAVDNYGDAGAFKVITWAVVNWFLDQSGLPFSLEKLVDLVVNTQITQEWEDGVVDAPFDLEKLKEDNIVLTLDEEFFRMTKYICRDEFEIPASFAFYQDTDSNNCLTKDLKFGGNWYVLIPKEALTETQSEFTKKPWGHITYYNKIF